MGGASIDTAELAIKFYQQAKGFIKGQQFSIMWDLTNGMTEDEYVRSFKRERGEYDLRVCSNGRIIIPELNVY